MSALVASAIILIGFIVLIKGADLLVDGGGSLAKRFNIPELVIGLTVVSFGTSSPELVVNVLSALSGESDLALGNIIGSNISNTFLILGVAAIIYPLTVHRNTVWKEIPLAFIATLAVAFLANDVLIDQAPTSIISRADGLVLYLLFAIFLYYTYGASQKNPPVRNDPEIVARATWKSSLMVLSGMGGLVLGGTWIVDGAITIASTFGISESVIGLSILAIGTSVPELATSAVAAWRKNADIAIGNVVGSNIFNLLFVLATTSIVAPLPFNTDFQPDLVIMIASAMVVFVLVFRGAHHRLERWHGYLFLGLYGLYITYLAITL